MSQMCQISFVGSSIRFLALALALSLAEGTKSNVNAVNKICPIYLLIIHCSFLFAVQNIELLFFSDRGAIIAILHCLSPLSDCLIVCTVQRVLIQQVKREEEFATCSNEKM